MSSIHEEIESYFGIDFEILIEESKIGNIIGSGQNSIVVETKLEYFTNCKIECPVLIVTKEKNKRNVLNAVFKNSDAKTQSLKTKHIKDEFLDIFLELEGAGFYFFLASKLETNVFCGLNFEVRKEIQRRLELFSSNNWESTFNSSTNNLDYIICNLESEFEAYAEDGDTQNEELIKEFTEASIDAFKSLSECELDNEYFKVDLHGDQFCRTYSGQLICIDPIFMEIN